MLALSRSAPASVVFANKAPLVLQYQELHGLAKAKGAQILNRYLRSEPRVCVALFVRLCYLARQEAPGFCTGRVPAHVCVCPLCFLVGQSAASLASLVFAERSAEAARRTSTSVVASSDKA